MTRRKSHEGDEAPDYPYTGPDDPARGRGEPYEPPQPGESADDYAARTKREEPETEVGE